MPHSESARALSEAALRFPSLRFEAMPRNFELLDVLGVGRHDFFLFDG